MFVNPNIFNLSMSYYESLCLVLGVEFKTLHAGNSTNSVVSSVPLFSKVWTCMVTYIVIFFGSATLNFGEGSLTPPP